MPDTQVAPNTDDKITALETLVTKLAHKVDGMVSKFAMHRSDSAHRNDDRRDDDRRDDDDKRDDDRRDDDDDKAKKDAARDTLFGGKKRKDAKRDDDDKRDDAEECEEEEEKEAKGDDDKRDDAEEEEEKKSEPEPMASDDDRRKDRRKDARRDDDDDRKDARRRDDDDDRKDDRRDDDDDRKDRRSDTAYRNLQREFADLKRSLHRPRMSDDELNALAERQQEWDSVAQMHGQRASRPLDGERIESYDRRLAKTFQKYSEKWKSTDLSDMPISVVTKVIAPEIRADARQAAYRSDPSPGAMQREIIKTDRTGRRISEFVGPVDAANGMFKPFELPPLRFRGFNRQPNQF
jgi:hypothetical protein